MIQSGYDPKQLRLADTRRPKESDDLALRAAFTDDVADLRVDIA